MQREFGVVRRQRRGGYRRRDRLLDATRRRQSAAQMAVAVDPIRAQLGQPSIGGRGLVVAVAIAEHPGADPQQRRVACGFGKPAPDAGERIPPPPVMQQRLGQLAVQQWVEPSGRAMTLHIAQTRLQRSVLKRRKKVVCVNF